MGHVLAWCESASLSLSLSRKTSVSSVSLSTTPPSIFSTSRRNRYLLDGSVSNRRWCLLVSLALLEASVINRRWCRLVSVALPEASVMIDDVLSSSISLSSTPPRRLVEKHVHASVLVSLSPRRPCDESLGVSRCRSPRGWSSSISFSRRLAVSISSRMKNHPEDEAPPSLSLGVSRCRSPLSGSELSSTSTKER